MSEFNEDIKKCWIETFSGIHFYPFDPKPCQINIIDIAHALSMLCRYTGHTKRFYSVAEHSVWVSSYVKPEHSLAALLHDASEAYIGDISRPVKYGMSFYQDVEKKIQETIFKTFNIKMTEEMALDIKKFDNVFLMTEAKQLMKNTDDWLQLEKAVELTLPCFDPITANRIFLDKYNSLIKTSVYSI